MRLFRSLLTTAAATVAALSCAAATAQSPALTTLRIGVLPISDTLPLWVGRDEGLFKTEGIDLDIVPTGGGAVAIPAMEGGSLDMAYSDVGTVLRASEQGLQIKIVAPAGIVSLDPVKDGANFMVAADSPIKTPADIKGKKLAIPLLRNLTNVYVVAAIEAAGTAPGTYSIVEVPYAQMPDALLNKQVDMIYQVEPYITILRNSGKVRDLGSATYALQPNLRFSCFVASDRTLKRDEAAVRRFQRGYQKAVAFVTQHPEMLGDWQVKYFRLPEDLKTQVAPLKFQSGLGPDYVDSVNKTKALMIKYKFLDADMDIAPLILR